MDNNIVKISILATCIERDTFEISKRYYVPTNSFLIESFLQSQSIFSMYANKYKSPPELTAENFLDYAPFLRKCMLSNIYKTTWEHINSYSDFLIIDAAASRFNMLVLDEKQPFVYTVDEWWDSKYLRALPRFNGTAFHTIYPWDLDSDFYKMCKNKFVEDVHKRYKDTQLIINEAYLVEKYIDSDNNINNFTDLEGRKSRQRNELIRDLTVFFKESFPAAHIIAMPQNVFANAQHKWGLNQLHYVDEYYTYLISAIDIISQKHSRLREESMLAEVKDYCENSIEEHYKNFAL